MKSICVLGTILIFLTVILACDAGRKEEGPSAEQRKRDVDRLRSLPYVGGSAVAGDEPVGVVQMDSGRTCPGYRLYTVAMLARADLIDIRGEVLRSWRGREGDRWVRSVLLPDGDLLVVGMEDHGWKEGAQTSEQIADSSRYVMRMDWNGDPEWKHHIPAHHDIELTPDGKLLVLTFTRRVIPAVHQTIEAKDDQLTLLDPDGTVVESRSMLESVENSPGRFLMLRVAPSLLGVREWVDLLHSNSVEWMHHKNLFSKHPLYDPGNILVCFRHQNRIAIFDWQRRTVVWSWGKDQLDGPHDAQVLENGNILVFDNGLARGWTRVIEMDPLTGGIMWEYRGNPQSAFYTASKGSSQRLPNGNTLVAESDKGRAVEITHQGEVVWEFVCPYGYGQYNRAAIVRMVHHSTEFIDNVQALAK